MIYTQAFLDAYRRQNPRKYEQKFGDKTLEEINGLVKPEPVKEEKLKVEVTTKEEIETTFASEPDAFDKAQNKKLDEYILKEIKPKRGRKKVANGQE